eukprot:scaffold8203_cov143-Skeletonema_dohrnii-CCMP3373.AAC.2
MMRDVRCRCVDRVNRFEKEERRFEKEKHGRASTSCYLGAVEVMTDEVKPPSPVPTFFVILLSR